MIIEFIGIPGCGKTFLSEKIAIKLRKDRIKCINLVEKSRTNILFKIYFKILQNLILLFPQYRALKRDLMLVLSKYAYKEATYNICNIDSYLDTIIFYSYLYKKYRNKHGLYILDEGICQQMINIIVNYDVTYDLIDEMMALLNLELNAILLENTVDNSIESIKKRNRHVCFIDELPDRKLKDFLILYSKASEIIGEKFSICKVKRNNPLDKNLNIIFNYLNRKEI